MNTFQQLCPSCRSTLELPVEARDRSAVCPACEFQFVANRAPEPRKLSDGFDSPRAVPIETILGDALAVFSLHKKRILLPFLVPAALILVFIIAPMAWLSDYASVNQPAAIGWALILSPLFLLIFGYAIWVGLSGATHACDSSTAQPRQTWRESLIPRSRSLIPVVSVTVLGIVVLFVIPAIAIAISQTLTQTANVQTQIAIALFTVGLLGTALMVSSALLWPVVPLAMLRSSMAGVFRTALAISGVNLLTSFLLIAFLVVINGFGAALMLVGLTLTIPFSCTALVVAAHRIGGKEIVGLEI